MASSTTTETTATKAADIWKSAQKCRRSLQKRLEQLRRNEGKGNEDVLLKALDEVLCTFRLGCVGTVWEDFVYAAEQNTDKHLWNMHSTINGEFRRVISRLNPKAQPRVAVLHRQVQKMHGEFLRTSQKFYKGYLQRLSARYALPELDRVVQGIKFDVTLDKLDRKSPAGFEISIIRACYEILVHLGDLARYRLEADRKPHKYEIPLLYLRLANDLLPTSGLAYHQMAVVYRTVKDQDLALVYHLYRALVTAEPHPMAAQNLEIEVKKLKPGTPIRGRNASMDPQTTLSLWFVRLHAIYYIGATVPQQKELEREVLHRIQMLLVAKDSVRLLLTLALTSMGAYHFALRRADEKWSEAVSKSCQFLLCFNIRFISSVCQVLTKEVQQALQSASPADGDDSSIISTSDSTKATERLLMVMESSLPLLRVFMVWLCVHRGSIVKYASHLSTHVSDLHQFTAEAITLLIEVFRHDQNNVSTASYMLPEDLETLGFDALKNDGAPFLCRALHFLPDGTPKLRLEECPSAKLSVNGETLARINDIINCGYFIGTDPSYPLSICQKQKGSRVMAILVHNPEESKIAKIGSTEESNSPVRSIASYRNLTASWTADDFRPAPNAEAQPQPAQAQAQAPINAPPAGLEESTEMDFDVDEATLGRLNDFLNPPEVNSPQGQDSDDQSYGMHSATANDIFGAIVNQQLPQPTIGSTSTSSRPVFLAPLPWDQTWSPIKSSGCDSSNGHSPKFDADAAFNRTGNYGYGADSPSSQRLPAMHRTPKMVGLQAQDPTSTFPNTNYVTGTIYAMERTAEIPKQTSWQFDQRRQPANAVTSNMPTSSALASASMQSSFLAASASPIRQPYNQPPGFTDGPFFQSSNFSSSVLPSVNGSWGKFLAIRRPKPTQNSQSHRETSKAFSSSPG